MPLQRRLPKFGFKNPFRKEYQPVNLGQIARLIAEGKIDASQPLDVKRFIAAGLADKKDRIKILGTGKIGQALQISAHAFSASARQKIEAAGGSATVLE